MKIVVIGAGQVGTAVATHLASSHEITLIDHDTERLDAIRYRADVITIEGDGADFEVLEEANIAQSQIVIACTDNDRTNILVCGVAKMLAADVFTLARVTESDFLKAWSHTQGAFDVDVMIGSNRLSATKIVGVVHEDSARAVEYFADNRIKMAEFRVGPDIAVAGKTVEECDVYDGLRYAAVFSDDRMEVARGKTVIQPGSRLLVIGKTEAVRAFGVDVCGSSPHSIGSVFVLGGTELGFEVARLLEERGHSPKVVELDADRANFLARRLHKGLVLNADPLDPEFMKAEGVARADVVICAQNADEKNLMACLHARALGAGRIISVIHDSVHQDLFEHLDLQDTFNPRNEVFEEIIRHTRSRRLEKVTFIEHHQGEVIEVKLSNDSPLAAQMLKDGIKTFPESVVIAAISRKGEIIIPTGDTILKTGDDLVLFADANVVDEVVEQL